MRWIPRKWWLLAAVVVLVAAGGGSWLWLRGDDDRTAAATVTVSAETVRQTVSATGTVTPVRSADLDFGVAGTVTAVEVAAGDKVARGQALAQVDDTSLVASRTAAAAQLAAAKTQLSTDIDAGASAVQLASDRAAIVSAQDSYDAADQAVADATLRATIAGTVTSLNLEVGDTVGSAGSSVGGSSGASATGSDSSGADAASASTSSTAAVSIVSDNSWLVVATVSSADIAQLKPGLQAQIAVTGMSETVYGTVRSVGLVAQTSSSGAAVFPVTIKVTGKRPDLFSGTSATASIIVKQMPNVLTVASRALRTSGDQTYVMKVVDGKPVKQVVTIGDAYGPSTVITAGLASGDQVQLPGLLRLPAVGGGSGRPGGSGAVGGLTGGGFTGGGFTGGGGGLGGGTGFGGGPQ